jgi:replication initiation and membrane attachment protein DnaB
MRLFQYRIAQAIENRQKYWLPVIGVAVVALYVFVIHRWDKSLNPPLTMTNAP